MLRGCSTSLGCLAVNLNHEFTMPSCWLGAQGSGLCAAGNRGDASVCLEIPFAPWIAAGSVLCARSRWRPTSSRFDLTCERRSNFLSASEKPYLRRCKSVLLRDKGMGNHVMQLGDLRNHDLNDRDLRHFRSVRNHARRTWLQQGPPSGA